MRNPYHTRKANEILRAHGHTPLPRQDQDGGFTVSCAHCEARVSVQQQGDTTAYTPDGTHRDCPHQS
jgi:hypothetical protein